MIEVTQRENLGIILKDPQSLLDKIKVLDHNSREYEKNISEFFDENIFNQSNSEGIIYDKIVKINSNVKNRKLI